MTDLKNSEPLKGCPWCGEEPVLLKSESQPFLYGYTCDNSLCTRWSYDKDEAIELWNGWSGLSDDDY